MSKEFREVDICRLSIQEDLTDDEDDAADIGKGSHDTADGNLEKKKLDDDKDREKSKSAPTIEQEQRKSKHKEQLQDRKKRIAKLGQRAASLKFSVADFVVLSPDKLKQHYKMGKLKHRGGSNKTPEVIRSSMSRSVSHNHQSNQHQYSSSTHSSGSLYRPTHANVHECTHRETGIQRAVKVEKKVPRWMRNQSQNSLVQEFQILRHLDHPSLLRAYELFEGKDHYYMIEDYCEGGDLCDELDTGGCLEEQDAALLMYQLLGVLSYCHANHVVHANIKPEHILLEHGKDLNHIRLTDFSCAIILESTDVLTKTHCSDDTDDEDYNSSDTETAESFHDNESSSQKKKTEEKQKNKILPERKGTPEFWAPEVVLRGSTSPKRDVWACGVLCYLILSNRFPFEGDTYTQEDICEKIIRGEFSFGSRGRSNTNDGVLRSSSGIMDNSDQINDNNNFNMYVEFLEDDDIDSMNSFGDSFDWSTVSEDAKDFIQQLLIYEEADRPSARQALQHPWLKEMMGEPQTRPSHRFSNSSAMKTPSGSQFVNSLATMAAWDNVGKFNSKNKLKQATLTFLAAQMVLKEERKAIDHVFRALDTEKDGRLSRAEVKKGYAKCFHRELADAELDDLFSRVDFNNTGFIEYSEFVVAAMNEKDLFHSQKIQHAFSVFDKDGSGFISKEDLKATLAHFKRGDDDDEQNKSSSKDKHRRGLSEDDIDDSAIDKIIRQADMSGDGQISFDEFKALLFKTTDDEPLATSTTGVSRAPIGKEESGMLSIGSAVSSANLSMLKFTTNDFVAQRPGELATFYDIEDYIDEGSFGKVFVCRHKATDAERALKVLEKSRWKKNENNKVLNEFQILKMMAHPNIIKFFDLFQDSTHYYIVMEICRGGDLCDELITWGKLSEEQTSILVKQVLSCLNYCHGQKVIHRDIKPDNILLEENKDFSRVKLIDFGFATSFEDGVEMTDRVGTPEYMSPEIAQRSYFGSKCDVWSVGVVCYLCLSDKFPFNSKSRQDLFQQIVDGNYTFPPASWDTVSEDAKDFINGMLTVNPENRPSAEKVLQHEWLATARRSKIIGRPKFEVTDDTEKLDNQLAALKTMNALENLKRATLSKQKEVIKTFIASQLLLSDEKKAINAVFRELDITCNGKLSKIEVKAAYFKFFGYSMAEDELKGIFDRLDPAGTGSIGYDEFVVASLNEKVLLHQDKLKKAFDLFDTDGNGLICAADLKVAMGFYIDPEKEGAQDDKVIRQFVKEVDADGDGMISYDEFLGLMML